MQGCISFLASHVEVACWIMSGVRQANHIRMMYLDSVLRQDVAFFDVEANSGSLLQGINEDTLQIQTAISDKVGLLSPDGLYEPTGREKAFPLSHLRSATFCTTSCPLSPASSSPSGGAGS